MKKKKLLILMLIITLLIIIILVLILLRKNIIKSTNDLEKTKGITVVPTMNDEITADSGCCGTFQLVWNDMENEVVKQDIIFTPQLKIVENLNKEDFNESMLSEEYYYKIYGLKTLELKNKIENEILFLLVLPGASPALISAEHSSCCTWVNRLAELLIRDPPLRGSRLITQE